MIAHLAGRAAPFVVTVLVSYRQGWTKTPLDWIDVGIGRLLGSLAVSGCGLAYRRVRAKGPAPA